MDRTHPGEHWKAIFNDRVELDETRRMVLV